MRRLPGAVEEVAQRLDADEEIGLQLEMEKILKSALRGKPPKGIAFGTYQALIKRLIETEQFVDFSKLPWKTMPFTVEKAE